MLMGVIITLIPSLRNLAGMLSSPAALNDPMDFTILPTFYSDITLSLNLSSSMLCFSL